MKIDFSGFLEHIITGFTNNEATLRKYAEKTFNQNTFRRYINFLKEESIDLYKECKDIIENHCKEQNYEISFSQDEDIIDNDYDKYTGKFIINTIMSNKNLLETYKKYLNINPVATLLPTGYIVKGISTAISNYLRTYEGMVYVNFEEKTTSFCLNSKSTNGAVNINESFLHNSLKEISDNFTRCNKNLIVEIDENILKISYDNKSIKAILVKDTDINKMIKIFSYKIEPETSNIMKSFINGKLPYGVIISYLDRLNEYIDYNTGCEKNWVVDKFELLKNKEYYRLLSERYSMSVAVFMNETYPNENISDLI